MKKLHVGKIIDKFIPSFLRPYWESIIASPIGYRIAHGAFWSIIGTGTPQALNLISSIVLARLLGKVYLGEWGMIINTSGMFSVFSGFALSMTAIKHVAEFRVTNPAKAGRIIALLSLLALGTAVLMAVILIVAAPWLAKNTLAAPHLANLLAISAGIIFFGALNGIQIGALVGLEAFRTIAWINIRYGLILFILLTGGVYFYGLPGAVWGMVAAGAFNCIISNIELRNEARHAGVPISFAGCGKEMNILIQFSLPAVLTGILSTPANWACAAMLVNLPNGYAELGIYGAASSWQKVILFLPQCLNTIALPMLSDFHGTKQSRQYRKTFWYNIIMIGISAMAVAVVVALASPYIMKIYGTGFSSGRYVLMIISITGVVTAVNTFIGVNLISKGKIWFGFVSNLVLSVLLVAIAYFMIPAYGAIGLSLTMLISYFLQTSFNMFYGAKYFKE